MFSATAVPDTMFPIGDSVYVYPNTFRGSVSLHIRRFKLHGSSYYPTVEGVTLQPWWIESVLGRKELPKTPRDLRGFIGMPEDQFQITSLDFKSFTFTRFLSTQKCITLTASQWSEMVRQYTNIVDVVLQQVYSVLDFVTAFNNVSENPVADALPDCLDVNLGVEYLSELLRMSLRDCIKEKGNLQTPRLLDCEELWGNRDEPFFSAALSVEALEIADSFYHRLWDNTNFLSLKPAMYVTRNFLNNVQLAKTLKEVKNILWPENAFEFYSYE